MTEVSDMDRLRRFLCLGSEGTYRVGSGDMATLPPALPRLLADGKGEEVVREVVQCHSSRRFARHASLLLTLAFCARSECAKTKQAAFKTVPAVCESPTDLFGYIHFAKSIGESRKGWGRALRKAVSDWYNTRDPMVVAELTTKYKTSFGWSHLDVLRLSHTKPSKEGTGVVLKYLVKGYDTVKKEFGRDDASDEVKEVLQYLGAIDTVKHSVDDNEVARLVEKFHLGKEHVPTKLLNQSEVWTGLLDNLSLMDLLQSIGKLASLGLLEPQSNTVTRVVEKLHNEEAIKKSRVSPISILIAIRTYEQGKGKIKWTRNDAVVNALNSAFSTSILKNIQTTNKRYLLAVKVNTTILRCSVRGSLVLSPTIAVAGLARIFAQREPHCQLVYFVSDVKPLKLTPQMELPDICKEVATSAIQQVTLSSQCDMSAPIMWAKRNKKPFDTIIILTDSKESTGEVTPAEAIKQYRRELNLPQAKLVVCGLTASKLHHADISDFGMLDIAGFDASVPNVIRNFATDNL